MKKIITLTAALLLTVSSAYAASVKIPMYLVLANVKQPQSAGYVEAVDTHSGLKLIPHLHGLPPGIHGFHVHVNPSCKENAMAAGGHLDPAHTDKHLGPYNTHGHLGDLPVLVVNKDGTATAPVLAPRLTVADIKHHSLMIHAGGDNYSDYPEKLGGGGARLACGVIK